MELPPLNTLRVFEAAARHGSFVRAAQELHVTHGAVSRQIRLLEESLCVALFERRNRAVFLTAAGEQLRAAAADAFSILTDSIDRIARRATSSALVVSCEPTLAMRWLIPRLSRFQARHPSIQVHLFAAGGPIDLARTGVDVALRRNDFAWPAHLHAEPICEEWIGPVHAPQADAAARRRLLHTATRPDAWQTWWRVSGAPRPRGRLPEARYEHFYLSLQAALAGQGTAIASKLMAGDDLKDGRLMAPDGFRRDGSAYYLLANTPIAPDSPAGAWLAWLCEETAATLAG
ncbi:LysR substrate-binding domain-containing protein [Ralstonia sp. UBA689]|uniref:LysR substrate-binding domain-containing protein n=1 Tax=Ralstonia sp. UBA689 TaxID=1947373 RepID=UPI0025D20605|nr:LysR substrate-binding domain-containing protein [Ralstonia sp. UBA689]